MDSCETALRAIRCRALLRPGERVLVGLSGGADSVALSLLLAEFVRSGELDVTLRLAHLDHGLRGQASEEDAEFCRRFARDLGLPIVVDKAPVSERRRRGESLEAAARRERFSFLRAAAESVGATAVALGHHADDVAETVLLRLVRGCGLAGLAAMPWSRPWTDGDGLRVVRPLLDLRKGDLAAFLRERGQDWREDATNADDSFLRNRLRNKVLPVLSRAPFSLGTDALPALHEAALALDEARRARLDAAWPGILMRWSDTRVELARGPFQALDTDIRKRCVRKAIGLVQAADTEPGLARAQYDTAACLAEPDGPAALQFPGGVTARREHDAIVFAPTSDAATGPLDAEFVLDVPGRVEAPALGCRMTAAVMSAAELPADLASEGPDAVFLRMPDSAPDTLIRTRRAGDRFRPLGAPGGRKLKDFLIDRGVPRASRDRLPLVVIGGEIAWVVGCEIADDFRLRGDESRVLHLHVEWT